MVYLAKVDDALTTTVTGLKCKWSGHSLTSNLTTAAGFKIYEDGLDSSGEWAVTRLYRKGKVDFVLPSCVPAGQ
jgi:cellulase